MTGTVPRHLHPDAEHTLIVVKGQVVARPGSEEILLGPGDYISIPAEMPHNYRVPEGEALLVSFDAPAYDPKKTVQIKE